MKDADTAQVKKEEKSKGISAFEPKTLIFGIILSFLSAVICMQIIGKVGTTPNTSLIGAIFAMIFARLPLSAFKSFRSLERQNLLQTIVSGAGFSAANCGFIAIAIMFIIGSPEYIIPMAIGTVIGSVISVFVVGSIFDSKIFPAAGAWPPGVATASAIQAGDEGGKKGRRLIEGLALGVIGSYFKIPVAGIGIVFIANLHSMIALGVGLILRGYSKQLFGFDMGKTNIAQGIMIGAGLMALIQCVLAIVKGTKDKEESQYNITVSDKKATKSIGASLGLHIAGAFVVAAITGIISQMSIPQLILWTLWTGFSSTVAMALVGMAAMRSGWFPAFAITTIFMTFGVIMGFPPLCVAVMTGYISSVGPCFADMGYDLKTGWILRGRGQDPEYELYGRRQQVYIEAIGVVIGIAVVVVFGTMFMKEGLFPPISNTFVTTIKAGADPAILKELLLWAIPGAVIQLAFGTKMVGVLFATGLILNNPIYGIGVLGAVVVRMIFGTEFMEVRDAGLIAGDGIYGFISSVIKAFI
ncbi:MAG: OPT/YSL family transporter [Oscillospiraceae bacterium]